MNLIALIPSTVYISTLPKTATCGAVTCWISPVFQPDSKNSLSIEPHLFHSIIKQAKQLGLSGVKLTGGEPLLHPSIIQILELLRVEDLDLNVETNGILCTPELARNMAACKNPFISVSLDGADARTHEWIRGVEGCFEAALTGIRNLVKAGFTPQIIMTIMRCNKEQMEAIVRLAERLGAGSVKFNILQATARGKQMHAAGETLSIEELVELGQWVETDLSPSAGLTVSYSHPPAFRPLGNMFGDKTDGCSACGILGILGVLANGSYALCGIGQTVPDLIFGHSAVDRLEKVWNNSSVLDELRRGLPHRFEGVCGDCVMKNRCLGSCIAQNYYSSRNFWSPHWYCDKAHRLGLFPDTRIRSKFLNLESAP